MRRGVYCRILRDDCTHAVLDNVHVDDLTATLSAVRGLKQLTIMLENRQLRIKSNKSIIDDDFTMMQWSSSESLRSNAYN